MMKTARYFNRKSLLATLAKYIGPAEAGRELDRVYTLLGIRKNARLTPELYERVGETLEHDLGGEVGEAMARAVITDRLSIGPEDVGRFYESFLRMRRQLLERQRSAQRLNEELTHLKELYENVSDSIPMGLCSVDMEMTVTSWNRAMASLTGIPAARAIGAKAGELIPEYEPLLERALKFRKAVAENRFQKGGGEKRIESVTVSPLLDRFGALRGLALVTQDVTRHVEMEENILRAEKLASVGRLAAGVAHEVGNPLTSISALAQELSGAEGDDPEFRRRSLELVGQHIRRIGAILKNLVDYSRKSDGGFKASSLREIVDQAAPLLRLDNRGLGVELVVDVPDDLPKVYCDQGQIQQVLINLLFNAADAMEGHGVIRLEARRAPSGGVLVRVADTGHGMSEETLKQAMTPFFTTKPVGKGTGLGLYVCYNILENHLSRLTVKSAPGQGAEFSFILNAA
ncbi:MAG: PAS domain-containing protein [Nitrospinae bacterium]|nr:PAS domain-containing protein [Nitrospinota bacterium]